MILISRLLGVMLFLAGLAQAQGEPQLTITVLDPSGARVSGVEVTLTRGNEERRILSASDGTAQLRDLSTGEWSLTLEKDGFAVRQRPVVVQTTPVSVSVNLEIAAAKQNVTVQATLAPPDTLRLDAAATGGTLLDLPIRDLPATLTVVTQETMQERGAYTATEAIEVAGGTTTSIGVGSLPSVNSRGFGGNSASIMRDGIRQNTASQSARQVDTFLLDRVEVLKGPASLLYGEGAIGASVNYVSKEPGRQWHGDSLLQYGSFGSTRTGIGLNIPIRSNLAARIDTSYSDSSGWVKRNDTKLRAISASVRWTPIEGVMIKPSATYTDDQIQPYYSTPLVNGAVDPKMRFINYNFQDATSKAHNNFGRLDTEIQLPGGWRLRNGFFAATQRLDWHNMEGYSYNATTQKVAVASYFLIWRDDILVGNQTDARKSFKMFGKPVNVITGVSLQRNDQHRGSTPAGSTFTFNVDPYNPAPIYDPHRDYFRDRDVLVNTKTLFAEGVMTLTERLKVITGLRAEVIRVDYTALAPPETTTRKTYHPVTGRLGAVYTAFGGINLYVSYSRATEPQTQLVSLAPASQVFHLTPSRQWEAGAKATTWRGKLEGTVAYYSIVKRDIPIRTEENGVIVQQQIGKQGSQGIETNFVVRPTSTLTLNGDLGFTFAKYIEFNANNGTGFVSRTGNTPAGIPVMIWNFTPAQRIGPFTFAATVRQVGGRWGDDANTVRRGQYTTGDAWVAVRLPRKARLTLRARNLTDKLYIPGTSATSARLPAPRSYDAALTMGF